MPLVVRWQRRQCPPPPPPPSGGGASLPGFVWVWVWLYVWGRGWKLPHATEFGLVLRAIWRGLVV